MGPGMAVAQGGPERVVLRVDGMACGGCAATVRALLTDVPGVHEAAVDRVSGIARLRIDTTTVNRATLVHRLAEAGFSARRLTNADPGDGVCLILLAGAAPGKEESCA